MSGLAAVTLILASLLAPAERVERTVWLMGTEARIVVEARSRPAAVAASEKALRALEAAEDRLSTWRPGTELARLNRLPAGERLALSASLAEDLRQAEACWRTTGGAFDPTVGALARAWGVREGGRQPTGAELAGALRATGMEGLRWVGEATVEKRAGLIVEEGGFGKGAGLSDALSVLGAVPGVVRAFLDLGGQVAMSGPGTVWTLTLADPLDRRRALLEVTVDGGSLATSGNSERGLRVGGRLEGHLLDPRSGRPAKDFGSLTVWSRRPGPAAPRWADCLSTGLYAAGPDRALAWAAEHPDVEVLVLESDDHQVRARATPGFRGRLRPLTAGLTVRIGLPEDSES